MKKTILTLLTVTLFVSAAYAKINDGYYRTGLDREQMFIKTIGDEQIAVLTTRGGRNATLFAVKDSILKNSASLIPLKVDFSKAQPMLVENGEAEITIKNTMVPNHPDFRRMMVETLIVKPNAKDKERIKQIQRKYGIRLSSYGRVNKSRQLAKLETLNERVIGGVYSRYKLTFDQNGYGAGKYTIANEILTDANPRMINEYIGAENYGDMAILYFATDNPAMYQSPYASTSLSIVKIDSDNTGGISPTLKLYDRYPKSESPLKE